MNVREVLARRRVTLGFVFGALALWFAQPTAASLVPGAAIAAIGEGLRVWAAGHLRKSSEVTTSGPYKLFAHPLYVGSAILGVGLAVASASVIVALLVGAYLTVTLTAAIREEEAFLGRRFGSQYSEYRRRGTGDEASRRFSMAQAIANREHRAVAGVVAVLLLLLWKSS